ncbi:MAG: hypothetical protein KKC46_16390 [Proteobacteria bacterium]|nr:hypothetical protein [Pseudomonadota bacterium]
MNMLKKITQNILRWILVMSVFMLVMPGSGQATDKYWIGGTGTWDEVSNWNPSGQPQNGDKVYLTQTDAINRGVYYYNTAYPSAVLNSLRIDATGTGMITLFQGLYGISHALNVEHEDIGQSGNGTYIHMDGTNTVNNNLILGGSISGNGTYELSGTGSLSANKEFIGQSGTGVFKQTGGTNTITQNLSVGIFIGGKGTYELGGIGNLSVDNENIGVSGTGIFDQVGGTNTVTKVLSLSHSSGSYGTYNLNDGILNVQGNIVGGLGTSTFNIDGGTLLNNWLSINVDNFNVGYSSSSNGNFNMTGKNLNANKEYIGYDGTGTFNQAGGTNEVSSIYIGHQSGGNGTYKLNGTGVLSTTDFEVIGYDGTGVFTQTGGNNKTTYLHIGSKSGSTGTYELSGKGSLSAYREFVGRYGTGDFIQTGGTNEVSDYLSLGYASGSKGSYELSGAGSLSANWEYIGDFGKGTFTQSGGINTVKDILYLGNNSGSSGTYKLSGTGNLSAEYEHIGYSGTGVLTQSGGLNTTSKISLGELSSGKGTYNMSDGGEGSMLFANMVYVGKAGTGTVNQTGGIIDTTYLYLGYETTGKGTYSLSDSGIGSSLTVKNTYVGYEGEGEFNQSGGAITTDNLFIKPSGAKKGTYNLSGGSLMALNLVNNDTVNQSGGSLKVLNLTNNKGYNFSGGNLEANIINNAAADFNISGGGVRTVFGNVTNYGTVKTTDTIARFIGTYSEHGVYISDPSTNYFNTLSVEAEGYLLGGLGDNFFIETDFINNSTQDTLWDTDEALLGFTGAGLHEYYLAGEDLGADISGYTDNFAWGTLNVEGNLNLFDGNATEGGAQYLSVLDGAVLLGDIVSNISGQDGLNIYYLASAEGNEYLDGLKYNLTDGGFLIPITESAVPVPPAVWLFISGFIGLVVIRRRACIQRLKY